MTEEEYIDNTVQEILDKYPLIPSTHTRFLRLVLKYGSGNLIKQLKDPREKMDKDETGRLLKEVMSFTKVEKEHQRMSHRQYLLSLINVREKVWLTNKDDLVGQEVVYEHEKVEKPSNAEVLNLISSQEKPVIQQVVQLLPLLTEKEWKFIDSYRAAL